MPIMQTMYSSGVPPDGSGPVPPTGSGKGPTVEEVD